MYNLLYNVAIRQCRFEENVYIEKAKLLGLIKIPCVRLDHLSERTYLMDKFVYITKKPKPSTFSNVRFRLVVVGHRGLEPRTH